MFSIQLKTVAERNYWLNLAEGVIFISSAAFLSPQVILPALITRMGGGNVVIGALPVLIYVGLFLPQIFAARHVETIPWKKPWALRFGFIQRMNVLLMALAIAFLAGNHPLIALSLFLAFYALMHLFAGIATPGWFDFYIKITPANRRGRLAGLRTSLGALSAFFFGFLFTAILALVAYPVNYAIGLFLAFLLQMGSLGTQRMMIENEPSKTLQKRPLTAYLWELPEVLRTNPPFKEFLRSSAVLIIANMPIGFFTVYALKRFDPHETMVGEFVVSLLLTQVIGAFFSGIVADRHGNKLPLIIAACGTLAASLWALVAPSVGWFRIVFLLLGFNLGTEMMARYNISVEYGPAEKRSTYVALMNTALAPVYLSALVGGWIANTFGYPVLFAAGILFSIAGLYMLLYKVQDPRELKVTEREKGVAQPAA